MDSQEIKVAVSHYLRFKRQYNIVGTEYRFQISRKAYYADVIACNDDEVIELEIKISKQDLYAESKKNKHEYYGRGKAKFVPNRFYFVLTKDLYFDRDVRLYINSLNEKYGIILVDGNYNDRIVEVKKDSKKLHDRKPDKEIFKKMIKKITAENIYLREKFLNFRQ